MAIEVARELPIIQMSRVEIEKLNRSHNWWINLMPDYLKEVMGDDAAENFDEYVKEVVEKHIINTDACNEDFLLSHVDVVGDDIIVYFIDVSADAEGSENPYVGVKIIEI